MILPMKIGTPLSPNATRVMLLGSGELGKEVIIALQRLGVEVIAVDRYKDAPGHQVAHRSHVIDMTNSEALLNLVKSEKPQYIVPEIEAINTDVLAQIEKSGDAVEYDLDGSQQPSALVQAALDNSNQQTATILAQFAQMMKESNDQQTAALSALIQQITKPKSVVRDRNGKIIGVQ